MDMCTATGAACRFHCKSKVIPLQAYVAQRLGRGIALLFRDRDTRRGWVVSSTPQPHFTTRKDPIPILQEAGWALRPVWTGRKSRPHRDSIPDSPARNRLLYRLSYPAHTIMHISSLKCHTIARKVYFKLWFHINKKTANCPVSSSYILFGLYKFLRSFCCHMAEASTESFTVY